MKATVSTEFDSPDTLQRQEFKSPASKGNTPRQSFADAMIQFVVRHPRTFIFAYGCGPTLVALWLFSSSVQNGAWVWTSIAGVWLASIATCVGGLCYLLSNRRSDEFGY